MAATLYPMTGFEFVSDSASARDAARPLEAFLRGVFEHMGIFGRTAQD